jgi:hypothetical protein
MGARLLTLMVVTSLCVLASGFVFSDAPAQALTLHKYESQVTEVPAEAPGGGKVDIPGVLRIPESMTVNAGHLYVTEDLDGEGPSGVNSRTDVFSSDTGDFETQFLGGGQGVGVGHGTGETQVYVSSESGHEVVVLNEAGAVLGRWTGDDTPRGDFFGARGVAVDNYAGLTDWAKGDVYVADSLDGVIDVFQPEANGKEKYVTRLEGIAPGEPFEYPEEVAVNDTDGDVVVGDSKAVYILEPTPAMPDSYTLVDEITGPHPGALFEGIEGVAVDGGNGEIYIATSLAVYEFSQEGVFRGKITGEETPEHVWSNGPGEPPRPTSIGVDPISHRVFVGVHGGITGVVDVFSQDTVVPDLVTGPDLQSRNRIKNSHVAHYLDWHGQSAKRRPCYVPVCMGYFTVD